MTPSLSQIPVLLAPMNALLSPRDDRLPAAAAGLPQQFFQLPDSLNYRRTGSEDIRRITIVSTRFSPPSIGLIRHDLFCLTIRANSAFRPARKGYSTSRGALYPVFATIVYFIGLPFSSTIRKGSFVAGFTSCTVIFRNFPSFARFVD